MAAAAERRAGVYGIIAAVYARPADRQLLEILGGWRFPEEMFSRQNVPALLKTGLNALEAWFQEKGQQSSQELTEILAPEFTRLFRGIDRRASPPPPYESVYVDGGRLYGPSTGKVGAKLEQFGLKAETGEPPDHISLELELMRFLCTSEAAAWREHEQAAEWLREQSSFLNEHLLNWVPSFCDNVRKSDKTAFYKAFAGITEGWLEYERETIDGLIDR